MNDDVRNDGDSPVGLMNSAATGFLVGALVGAGVALLFAPARGEETRRRLGSLAGRAGDAARDGVGRAREALGRLRHDAADAVDAGRDAAREARDEINARLQS